MTRPKLSARKPPKAVLVSSVLRALTARERRMRELGRWSKATSYDEAFSILRHVLSVTPRLGYRIVPKPRKAGRGKGR